MLTVESHHGKDRARHVVLATGKRYLVQPINPQARKNRGRTCILEELDNATAPFEATVRFDDTNRVGKVRVSDLLLYRDQGANRGKKKPAK